MKKNGSVSSPIILFIFTQFLIDHFQHEAAKDGNRIVAVLVLVGSNDIKHCGVKTKHDDASHYPKWVDALLKQATEKLTRWLVLINAPVFLSGGGTPHKVIPTTDVPDIRLDGLDKFGYERKIEMMALVRARIFARLAYNCKNDDWDRFYPNAVHYVEKPLLNVRYANFDGHHGKIKLPPSIGDMQHRLLRAPEIQDCARHQG